MQRMELREASEMRTGGLIPIKGGSRAVHSGRNTLPGRDGCQWCIEWNGPLLCRERGPWPGQEPLVRWKAGGLLLPWKTLIPVSLTCSFSPPLPALIPGLTPASQVPACVAGISSTAEPLPSGSPAAKCLGGPLSRGQERLEFCSL